MTTTLARPVFGCLLLLTLAAPAAADSRSLLNPSPAPARASDRAALYSPRVRRSTAHYLRLRLLELRETGLDRARAVIERRLRVDDLLKDTPSAPEDAARRNKHSPQA